MPIEPAVTKKIFSRFRQLDLPWDKLKVVSPGTFHLTIKFLGDTPIEKLDQIIEALSDVKIDQDFIEMHIDNPKIIGGNHPRVLTLSLEENSQLQKLYDQIEDILFDAGIAHKEVRRFFPHLTLARVKKATDASELKDFANMNIDYHFSVTNFDLQDSELTKQGPIHTVLQNFSL